MGRQNIQVYREENKVLFLKNDKSLEVKNGQTGYIKTIKKDGMLGIKMDNGRDISLNPKTQYKYLSHGYALTDYKAQGQTEKHVIYHADTKKGVNFNQAYVGITRGKDSVQIYTDNKALLLDAMQKDAVKTTTLDYTSTIKEEQNNLLPKIKETRVYTSADDVIKHAIDISTEHTAVIERKSLLKVAGALSVGEHRILDLNEAIAKNESLVNLSSNMYTTKEIMEMEQRIVDTVKGGQGKAVGIVSTEQVGESIIKYEQTHGFELTLGQKEAINHVLTSQDRIIAIQGDAGTGKTTMLDVVRNIAENEKREIVGLSFTGKAASEIQEASQIKSSTIASLVHSKDDLKGKLVVIDEASMLSIKDMDSLLNRSDKDTKIVLIGDTKQLQTLGQGKIFSSLQENKIISTVRMSEVQRQTNAEYKEIVADLGNKKVEDAFNKLDAGNLIHEIKDHGERLTAIKDAYIAKTSDTIIVTGTNIDRNELNQLIRAELIKSGQVQNNGAIYLARETKTIMGEEKYYAQSYSIGDLVVANGAGIIGKVGAEGRIMETNAENHTIKLRVGDKNYTVDLKQDGRHLKVYSEEQKQFAVGDKVLFLKNDKDLSVKNGQTGHIQNIRDDGTLGIKIDNGKDVNVNMRTGYNYLSHGYALTDYKSQGQTEKHVIYNADTKTGVSFNQAYVGVTRGKESVTIYTNNKEILLKQMKKEQNNKSTLDYASDKAPQKSDKPEVGSALPEKPLDAIDRFNKMAQAKVESTKHNNIISDPTVVSKISQKTSDKALTKIIDNETTKLEEPHTKDNQAQVSNKEKNKEPSRSDFER